MLYFEDPMTPGFVRANTSRKARSAREFVRGLVNTSHPLLVQIVPIRRCNIDCGYCNEYDKVSPPVPTDVMRRRIDKLAGLRHVGRRVQRRRADAAPGPRRPHPATSAGAA